MRLAPEGWPFIGIAAAVLAGLAVLGLRGGPWWPAVAWLPIAMWVVAFFRDPQPSGPAGPELVLAPADGRVIDIRSVEEPDFFQGPALRVSIFMNVFDCHVNRYPCDGTVAYRHYNPGRFLHAADEKASLDNEQSSVGLTTPHGKVMMRQIAGLIARRIVTDPAVGSPARQAERFGMIRFGSRVDLFLPVGTRVTVKVGDRTRVARTVVARWD